MKDLVGLKVSDILAFAEKYNSELEKINIPESIDSKFTPELAATLKELFNPFNCLQAFVKKMYNSFKFMNVKDTEGIALISRLLQMKRIIELLGEGVLACEDITNYVVNIILSVFTGKTFRIPVTDDQTQHSLKSCTL